MLSSSSGPGCHPLTVKIAGSNPAGSTNKIQIILPSLYRMATPLWNSWQSSNQRPVSAYVARPTQWSSGTANRSNNVNKWRSDFRWTKQLYVNEQIKAPKIMLISLDWENMWVMSRDQAFRLAQEKSADLMQISYNAAEMLCTAKMVEDIGKYLYTKQKEDKVKKKNQKQASKWFKEIKLSYAIWENDLQLKIKKTQELLEEWYSVKCVVRLRGRERWFAQKVITQLSTMQETLSHIWRSQYPQPKVENNWISIILLPKK